MRINIGANVECRGERVGTIKRLILDPTSFDLRQIVVARGGRLTAREILVPVQRIYEAKEDVLTLDMSPTDLDALPNFQETMYVPLNRVDRDASAPSPLSQIEPALASFYYIPQVPLPEAAPPVATEKSLEPNTREVRAGMDVYAGEHKVGKISKVIVDSSDKRTTSFVVERGWLFTHDVEIPADWVSSIQSDRILLNRTKEQIEEFDKRRPKTIGPRGGQPAV